MNLKYLALTFLMACVQIGATPPRLGWENGWCWDNALVQLLYNMRGLTECLLKNAGECRKKNPVLAKYIDLIAAIRKNPNGYFIEEMRAYHAAACEKLGCPMCKYSSANNGFVKLVGKDFSCCEDLFELHFVYGATRKFRKEPLRALQISENLNTVASRILEIRDTSPDAHNYFRLENIPQYLFFKHTPALGEKGWNLKIVDEQIDIAPILSDELKKTVKTCPYELIGVSTGTPGHATAYIKDQWEDAPSWYYCDDMAVTGGGEHGKVDRLPELRLAFQSGPDLLVYKRIDKTTTTPLTPPKIEPKKTEPEPEKAGEQPQLVGDDKDLEKLVQVLRELV